jgi:ATP-dependent Clp protease ATP-binding subunit ClpC
VEWEASALEFLLERGFSPEMGARPLKRAIDQYVIAPLAATIVERRFPEGDQFVFVRSDGKAIQAEFVDPDSGQGEGTEPGPASDGKRQALPAMIMAASGEAAELKSLEHHFETMQAAFASDAWEEVKAELAAKMQASDFWATPERYEVLSRLALMDRVRAASETAGSFRARLARGTGRGGKSSKELVARLALQLHLIGEGIRDVYEAAPIEAVLSVESALDGGGGDRHGDQDEWCKQLLAMYRAWAAARNMQLSEISAKAKEPPLLLIGGFGAYRTLSREAGLHVLEMPGEEKSVDRVTARIRVAAAPLGETPPNRLPAALAAALSCAAPSNTLVRRYRNGASPLVRDMVAGWRTGRLDAVLQGDFDLIAAA